jgi:small subunit ribosomal protein S5
VFEPATSHPLRRLARPFHSSASHSIRRRPHYASIKAEDLAKLEAAAAKDYPQLDTTDQALLAKRYSPSQIAAIRAAESAVDTRDLYTQGHKRTDDHRITYEDDDFSVVDGVLDRQPQKKGWSVGPGESMKIEFKTDEELELAYQNWCVDMAVKYTKNLTVDLPLIEEEDDAFTQSLFAEWEKFATNPRSLFNASSEEVYKMMEDPAYDTYAPQLPKLDDPLVKQTITAARAEIDPNMQRLQHRMGWSINDIRRIRTKVLVTRRVVNQTKMGKVASMYYLSVAGNGNGLMGIGEGKSTEPEDARRQSILAAIRNIRPIPRYENRTIYGEVFGKVGGVELYLRGKAPGTSPALLSSLSIR